MKIPVNETVVKEITTKDSCINLHQAHYIHMHWKNSVYIAFSHVNSKLISFSIKLKKNQILNFKNDKNYVKDGVLFKL